MGSTRHSASLRLVGISGGYRTRNLLQLDVATQNQATEDDNCHSDHVQCLYYVVSQRDDPVVMLRPGGEHRRPVSRTGLDTQLGTEHCSHHSLAPLLNDRCSFQQPNKLAP